MKNKKITLVLLPGLNGTAGLFDPLLSIATDDCAVMVDASAALAQIKIPLVYFRARDDFVVPAWNLKKIIAIKPNTKVVSFNCQHFILQSVPQAGWQAMDDFVREIR